MRFWSISSLFGVAAGYCNFLCSSCIERSGYNASYHCTSCSEGYFLIAQQCLSCDYYSNDQCQNSQSSAASFIIPTVVIFIAMAVIFCCCRYMCIKCRQYFARQEDLRAVPRAQGPQSQQQGIQGRVSVLSLQEISMQQVGQWHRDAEGFSEKESCVICLEETVFLRTYCKHSFHPHCLEEWVSKKQGGCPLCKSHRLSPTRLYCRRCFQRYREVEIELAGKMTGENRWNYCNDCDVRD